MPENEPHIEQANGVFRALDRDRDGLLSPAEFMEGLYLFPDLLQRMGEDRQSDRARRLKDRPIVRRGP
eukprot:g2134.t1